MKNIKSLSNLFLFSCLVFAFSAVLTSCGKEKITPTVEETAVKSIKEQLAFNRDFTIQDSLGENTVSFKVYANDKSKLEELTAQSFQLKTIYEGADTSDVEGGENILEQVPNETDVNLDDVLFIEVEEPSLTDGAKGIQLILSEEGTVRFNRASVYFYFWWAKRIYTSNYYFSPVKMMYFDDHAYAGYRELCLWGCSRRNYTFRRYDRGVGCRFLYHSNWGHRVYIRAYSTTW